MPDTRTIAVIGSNSFSGSDFVDLLLEDPRNRVLGISRSPEKRAAFLPYTRHLDPAFSFHQLDLNRDIPAMLELFDREQPAYIVNFAAQSEVAPSWDHPEHWFQTNVVALARLINALKDRRYLQRYVHISSPEVYGTCEGVVTESSPMNPSTPYAASKAAADFLLWTFVKQYRFPVVMIRSTNVYGAHQQLFKIIPRSVIALKLGKTIQLHGGGVAVKSYIHIRDVSRGELAVMERGRVGELYHLSPERGVAVREVVHTICEMMDKPFEQSTAAVAERPGQDAAYVIDSSKARREFGWQPQVELRDGIEGVIRWIETSWDELVEEPLAYVHKA